MIVSPFSVASALALLSQAANGTTYDELTDALHMSSDKNLTANQFGDQLVSVQKGAGQSTLSITNQLFFNKGQKWRKSFRKMAVNQFASNVKPLNFADSEVAAEAINKIVSQKTNEKINEIIRADALSSTTRFVLINAVYFKGIWDRKFDKADTKPDDFYINDSEKVSTDFMQMMNSRFNYAVLDDLDATALEIKYLNCNFSMIFLLPNTRTGLTALESKLKDFDIQNIHDQFEEDEVDIQIPKFKIEFKVDLKEVLSQVIWYIFHGNRERQSKPRFVCI